MSLAEFIVDDESITFYHLFFNKLPYLLLQPVGTKTPNCIKKQSLCHIGIAVWFVKHNFLL